MARKEESGAIQLIDDLQLLSQWMREDVLSLPGPGASTLRELFDFIVWEMKIREPLAPPLPADSRPIPGRDLLLAAGAAACRKLRVKTNARGDSSWIPLAARTAYDPRQGLQVTRRAFGSGAPTLPAFFLGACAPGNRPGAPSRASA
jgi:hypothetical protein